MRIKTAEASNDEMIILRIGSKAFFRTWETLIISETPSMRFDSDLRIEMRAAQCLSENKELTQR